jgi:hypothetical protein
VSPPRRSSRSSSAARCREWLTQRFDGLAPGLSHGPARRLRAHTPRHALSARSWVSADRGRQAFSMSSPRSAAATDTNAIVHRADGRTPVTAAPTPARATARFDAIDARGSQAKTCRYRPPQWAGRHRRATPRPKPDTRGGTAIDRRGSANVTLYQGARDRAGLSPPRVVCADCAGVIPGADVLCPGSRPCACGS